MKKKVTEVSIKFKPTPHLMFPVDGKKKLNPGRVVFRLQPNEGIIYTFIAKQPGAELRLQPVNLNFEYAGAFGIDEPPSAYQWLLYDAMKGDQTLFPKSDWIIKAWSILDPVIKTWEEKPWSELPNYAAGTWGPEASAELLRQYNREWNLS
jgi:glucose-6-phosphate 1-dehydrogenase